MSDEDSDIANDNAPTKITDEDHNKWVSGQIDKTIEMYVPILDKFCQDNGLLLAENLMYKDLENFLIESLS